MGEHQHNGLALKKRCFQQLATDWLASRQQVRCGSYTRNEASRPFRRANMRALVPQAPDGSEARQQKHQAPRHDYNPAQVSSVNPMLTLHQAVQVDHEKTGSISTSAVTKANNHQLGNPRRRVFSCRMFRDQTSACDQPQQTYPSLLLECSKPNFCLQASKAPGPG